MALIQCTECGNQVASTAAACPSCGAPPVAAVGTPLATIQQTSKRLKGYILIAAVLFWGGLLWTITIAGTMMDTASPEAGTNWMMVGSGSTMIGFGLWFVTRIRIWWHHK